MSEPGLESFGGGETIKKETELGDDQEVKFEAGSFDELEAKINEMGELEGSEGRKYSAAELIKRIQEAKRLVGTEIKQDSPIAISVLNAITRTGGLRDAVEKIIWPKDGAEMNN
jgi:polyhydroxyalkanoate synthesis regulator phasin